jgi:hypothetical protein
MTNITGLSPSDWGSTNHGHHLLDDSIIFFANKDPATGRSKIHEYALDGTPGFSYESADGYTADNVGDVQRLPGGNTLVAFSNQGMGSSSSVIQEVSPGGSIVLEIDLRLSDCDEGMMGGTCALGYVNWRDSLYGPPPDVSL